MGKVPAGQDPHIAKLPVGEKKRDNEFSASRKQHTKVTANMIYGTRVHPKVHSVCSMVAVLSLLPVLATRCLPHYYRRLLFLWLFWSWNFITATEK